MNNLAKILIISLFIIGGCSDDFLVQEPKGLVTPDNFYNTEADIKSGLNAVYPALVNVYRHAYHRIGEDRADLTLGRSTLTDVNVEFHLYIGNGDGRYNRELWNSCYEVIANTNAVLSNIEGKDNLSQQLKDRADAEARFWRSLMYYYLVNFFGDVPFITKQINSVTEAINGRTDSDEIFNQILMDLEIAKQNLPEISEYSGSDVLRPSKGAARMLIAKILFSQNNYGTAKVEIEQIINSQEYKLEPEYKDIFRVRNNNLVGQENILEIYHSSGILNDSQRPAIQQHRLPKYFIRGFENYYVSEQLIAKFDTINDDRYKDIFFYNSFRGKPFLEAGRYMPIWKFFDDEVDLYDADIRGFYEHNWILFRYADVLLMMAEAIMESNGSTDDVELYLNMVRNRAGLSIIELDGYSKDELIQEIYDERARELYCEGHRYIDLKSRGYEFFKKHIEPRLGSSIPETQMLLPIPAAEVLNNPNLDQNPGY